MPRKLAVAALAIVWLLAMAVAVGAARYFLNPIPLLLRAPALALARHPAWLLLHIACGVAAMISGLSFNLSVRCAHRGVFS
jgi:hypothetical protein